MKEQPWAREGETQARTDARERIWLRANSGEYREIEHRLHGLRNDLWCLADRVARNYDVPEDVAREVSRMAGQKMSLRDVVVGKVYRVNARNFRIAVAVWTRSGIAFRGAREKFGHWFLFDEYADRDLNHNRASAVPLEQLDVVPPADEDELLGFLRLASDREFGIATNDEGGTIIEETS